MARRAVLVAFCGVLVTGCGVGSEPSGEQGYLLLDREARQQFVVEIEGYKGAPILPLALDAGESVVLEGPDGRTSIDPIPGKLVHVHGRAGKLDWLAVGDEVRDDQILVHGMESAAQELGLQVGGEVSARGDGLWILHASDILDRVSFMNVPEGISETMPDRDVGFAGVPLEGLDPSSLRFRSVHAAAPSNGDDPGVVEALMVGVYISKNQWLCIDGRGRFELADFCQKEPKVEGIYESDGKVLILRPDDGGPIAFTVGQSDQEYPMPELVSADGNSFTLGLAR